MVYFTTTLGAPDNVRDVEHAIKEAVGRIEGFAVTGHRQRGSRIPSIFFAVLEVAYKSSVGCAVLSTTLGPNTVATFGSVS